MAADSDYSAEKIAEFLTSLAGNPDKLFKYVLNRGQALDDAVESGELGEDDAELLLQGDFERVRDLLVESGGGNPHPRQWIVIWIV